MAFLDNTGVTRLVTDLKARFAALTHYHAATDITSGTLSTDRGGTGMIGNPSMLTNLGSTSADTVFKAGPRPGVTGILPVDNGGTGGSSANSARISLGVPAASSIAYVEGTQATASHAAGSHFMLNGILRKATDAIASYEYITNSNSTGTTVDEMVSDAVSALKPVAFTATNANTNLSITSSSCFVACGVVFVTLSVKATAAVSAGATSTGYVDLATISEHPASALEGPALLWLAGSYAYQPTNFVVRTDGTVQVYKTTGMATGDYAYLSLFFKKQ